MLAVPSFRSLTPLSALGCFSGLAVGAAVFACVIADPKREHYGGGGGAGGGWGMAAESLSLSHHHSAAVVPPPPHHAIGWGILRAVGIFSVSVSGHSSLPALRASMANPEEFVSFPPPFSFSRGKKLKNSLFPLLFLFFSFKQKNQHGVLDAAFAVMGLLYGGIAAAGYYYFGDGSRQVITANLKENSPFGTGSFLNIPGLTLDNAIGGFVLLNAFTTYPALIMIVQDMIWALFSPIWARRGTNAQGIPSPVPPMQPLPRLVLRLAAATLTAAVAVGAYSSVADCLALLGGLSSMSCSLLLPAACYLKLASGSASTSSSPAGEPEEGSVMRRKKMTTEARRALVAMLVAGSALTAAVVGQSLAELIHASDDEDGGNGRVGSLVAAVLRRGSW